MALTNKIPPQAYTRETLVKAIEWLSSQPPAVRARANSADLIVSFYLQARRQHGGAAASQMDSAFTSNDGFKSDLRHLAQDLKRFEEPPSAPPAPLPDRSPSCTSESASEQLENIVSQHRQDSLFRHSVQQELRHEQTSLRPQAQPTAASEPPATRMTRTTIEGVAWNVDQRSLGIARELQDALNLSSEGEALRMLVSLGAERVRGLI